MLKNITIIGSGSWATALVKIFSESAINVSWLVRNQEQTDYILSNSRNPRYLSYAELDLKYIQPTSDAQEALANAELVIFAVPSAYLQNAVEAMEPEWLVNKQLAVSIKGFVPGTGLIPGVFLNKHFTLASSVMVISGPCHAEEIAMKRNTYVTIAGEDKKWVKSISDGLTANYIQTIASCDPVGVEYVAILKNIIGIATGIASGLNYGDNFQAVLTSNAMREVKLFLEQVHPAKRDIFDSVYFGDLLVTAYSEYSRNRTLGKLVGRGLQVNKALQSMEMVAEGFYASKELMPLLQQLTVEVPVITGVYRILHQHANPFHEFKLIEKQLR
ncbi:MAG: NAD(P)H-dependent glycerol-3-phosphate dehydrogenase [Panacibacter sp.]